MMTSYDVQIAAILDPYSWIRYPIDFIAYKTSEMHQKFSNKKVKESLKKFYLKQGK